MIKTKSILAKKSNEDGIRICVMRYVKPFYNYDEWLVDLAPSHYLLNLYLYKGLPWDQYVIQYNKEMNIDSKMAIIKSLKERSDNGQTITLLCWEKEDTHCHRRLLKELIEGIYL